MTLDPFKNYSDEELEIKYLAVKRSVEKKLNFQQQIQNEIAERKLKKNVTSVFRALNRSN